MKILNAEKGLALPAGSGSPLESLGNSEKPVAPCATETQGRFPPSVAPSDPVMTDNNHLSITPAVEAGPVPEDFDKAWAIGALYGSHTGLQKAFSWAGSLQGYGYWFGEINRLNNRLPLTDEAAAILREWIKQTEARS